MTNFYEALQEFAKIVGVEPCYQDNWGKFHQTNPETARNILETYGITISTDLMKLNPQVSVISMGRLPETIPVFFTSDPEMRDPEKGADEVIIREEHSRFPDIRLSSSQQPLPVEIDEKTGLLSFAVPVPQNPELGTYRVTVQCIIGKTTKTAECIWIICPAQAYLPPEVESGGRRAGVGIALYGVRSSTNWGIGDFHDLKGIIDWACRSLRVDFIGLNPLHALPNRRPIHHSPYLPSSRLYHNFIYLHIPTVEGFADSAKAQTMVNSPKVINKIKSLRNDTQVNYEEVAELKLEVLREIFASFNERCGKPGRPTASWKAFEKYRDDEGEHLERFSVFCVLHDHFRRVEPDAWSWRQWPEDFRHFNSEAVQLFRKQHHEDVLFRMFVQWQLDVQLRQAQEYARQQGMLIGLYLDQALAVDRDGADCWAWPEFFQEGFTVGAPPDAFAPEGQEWGFPPPNRARHRSSGYELFQKLLGVSCRHAGALRIDHVMQLHHLFWIPPGKKPKDGVYVKDYEEDLLNVLALAAHWYRTIVIGEDLGTVPLDLRDRLMAKNVLSYRLFYFETYLDKTLISHRDYPKRAIVSIATHDLPTFAGFWSGRDIDTRREMGMLDPEQESAFREDRTHHKAKIIEKLVQEGFLPAHTAHAAWESTLPTEALHTAVLKFLFNTPSDMVVISQEDLFLDVRQQNFPGTTREHPNWVTKMLYTVEELTTHPEATRLSAKFRSLLEETGRCASR